MNILRSPKIVRFGPDRQNIQKSFLGIKQNCQDVRNLCEASQKVGIPEEKQPLYKQWKKCIIISNKEKVNIFLYVRFAHMTRKER